MEPDISYQVYPVYKTSRNVICCITTPEKQKDEQL
jgi:hypothetical protein